MIIRLKLFLPFLILFLAACSKDKEPVDYIPYAYVNQQLNLTNIQYAALRQDRGHVYLPAGVRGIIVVRKSATQYLAFERNCTYQPSDSCATVEVDASNLF